jgi:hypothetical protein
MSNKLLDDLLAAGVTLPEGLQGLTDAEVEEVRIGQQVDRLPGRYVEYLRVMGRRAESVWVGTEAFYPGILSLKADRMDLLREDGAMNLMPAEAVVFAMHQGYQVYWMVNIDEEDPAVAMYQEGSSGIARTWPSFTECLIQDGCGRESPDTAPR